MRTRSVLALLAPALLFLACAPSALAGVRWSKPVAVPVASSTPGVTGAVDDRGRAVVAFRGRSGAELGHITGDEKLATATLPGIDGSLRIGLAADGTAIGVGTRSAVDPNEPVAYDPHAIECCSVPVAFRWAGGAAAPTSTDLGPLPQDEYVISDLAVRPDGSAVFPVETVGDGVDGGSAFVLARVPGGGGAPVLRRVTDLATDVLLAPGGATAAWRPLMDSPTFRRLGLDATLSGAPGTVRSPWRFDGMVALDGKGRVVRAAEFGRRLTISYDGGREHPVLTLASSDDVVTLATGTDGTVALATEHGRSLRVVALDPRGRLRRLPAVHTASAASTTFALAVDGRGHVHLAWRASPTQVAVRGPGGTHRFAARGSGIEVGPLVVSPRGAALVLWTDADRGGTRAAVGPAP